MLLIGGAALAGLVQGISGFAFAMVAMSVWVWGIEPRLAAVMAVSGGLVGQIFAVFTVRRGLRLPVLLPFLVGGLLGVPLGTWALPHLEPAAFKLTLGLFLVVCCPAMLLSQRLPRVSVGGRCGRSAGRRARRRDGRDRRLFRRAALAVGHAARLGQGPAAQRDPELQPGRAERHAGGLCRRRHGDAGHAAEVRRGRAGAAAAVLSGLTHLPRPEPAGLSPRGLAAADARRSGHGGRRPAGLRGV